MYYVIVLFYIRIIFIKNEINITEIDKKFESQFQSSHLKTVSVLLINKKDILFKKTYGKFKVESNTPFNLGSISKSFTALGILQLTEKKKLSMNQNLNEFDNLKKYLKEDILKKITVGELLNHTSGLESMKFKFKESNKGKFSYSNIGYGLLGKIIENISNKTYSDYMKENIFSRLNMLNYGTDYKDAKKNGLIKSYRNFYGFYYESNNIKDEMSNTFMIPAGFISISMNDMEKYLKFHLNKGDNIFDNATKMLEIMYNGTIKAYNSFLYGMGIWSETINNHKVYYHYGETSSFSNNFFIIPDMEIAGSVLINSQNYLTYNIISELKMTIINLLVKKDYNKIGNKYVLNHLLFDIIYIVANLVPIGILIFYIIRIKKKKEPMWIQKGIKSKIIIVLDIIFLFFLPIYLINLSSVIESIQDAYFTVILLINELFFLLVFKICYVLYFKSNFKNKTLNEYLINNKIEIIK